MPLPKLPGGGSLASTAGASAAAAVTRVVALRASRRVIIISFRLWIRETGNLFEPATQARNDARSTVGFAAYRTGAHDRILPRPQPLSLTPRFSGVTLRGCGWCNRFSGFFAPRTH